MLLLAVVAGAASCVAVGIVAMFKLSNVRDIDVLSFGKLQLHHIKSQK